MKLNFAFLHLKCWSIGINTTIFKHSAAVNVFNIACVVWCKCNQWTFRHNTIITMVLAKVVALRVSSKIAMKGRNNIKPCVAYHRCYNLRWSKCRYHCCYNFDFPSVFWTQGCRGCGIQVAFITCWCLCACNYLWNK